MTTLTSNDTSVSDPPSLPVGAKLALCVTQPGASDRTIKLPSGKSTVGSSARCQVQVEDPVARPLHCLIVREAATTTVTRWADGVLLNGSDFATAPFLHGDCLEIGKVQIRLMVHDSVAGDADAELSKSDSPTSGLVRVQGASTFPIPSTPAPINSNQLDPNDSFVTLSPEAASPVRNVAVQEEKITDTTEADDSENLVARLRQSKEGARARCRKLVSMLRAMRAEASGFDQRVDKLQAQLNLALQEREQILSQLSTLQSEAGERENQSAQEIDRLIAELTIAYEKASVAETALSETDFNTDNLRTELEQQSQVVQSELEDLRSQQQQWEQSRNSGELQRSKLAQAITERERTIDTLQLELEQFRKAADQADESRMAQASMVEGLQAELDSIRAERDQFACDQSAAQQCQAELEQSLSDSEQNLAVFQLELEKFQITSRQTDQDLTEKSSELEDMQSEFTQIKDERDQLVTKRTEYQLREQGWEHEIASRDSKIEDLTNEIGQLRNSVEQAVQGASSQAASIEESKQNLEAVTAERDQLLASQGEHLQGIRSWEEAVEARDRRIAELEQEHEGICEVLQSVEKGAFEQVDACNKLQDQLATLRVERDGFANALPEQREYIQQLEHALAERDAQITLLSDELSITTDHQISLESDLSDRASAYQALNAEVSELNARCEQLVAEGSDSSEALRLELNELKTRYEQLTIDHEAEVGRRQQLDVELSERNQNLELFQVDLQSLQAELARTAAQLSEMEAERETFHRQLTGLREELESKEATEEKSGREFHQDQDALAAELFEVRKQLKEANSLIEQSRGNGQPPQGERLDPQDENQTLASLGAEYLSEDSANESYYDMPEESGAESSDSAGLVEGQVDFHDAYRTEDGCEVADEYSYQPESEASISNGVDEHAEVSWDIASHEAQEVHDQVSLESADAFAAQEADAVSEPSVDSVDSSSLVDVSTSEDDTTSELDSDFAAPTTSESDGSLDESCSPSSDAFEKQDSSTEESQEQQTEEFKPTSFIDQYQHLLEESGEEEAEQVQTAPPTPDIQENRLGAEIDAMQSPNEDDSDEALEAYMQNMLRRMRGYSDDDHSPAPQVEAEVKLNQNPNPVSAVTDVLQNVAPKIEAEEPRNIEPIDMESLKRSSLKPALPTDLAAMRELANSSARKAIAKHHKRRHLEKAAGLFFVCLVAICVGVYMLLTGIAAQDFLSAKFVGGAIAVLIGAVGGLKLLKLLFLAVREGSWEKAAKAREAKKATTVPSVPSSVNGNQA